jgi:hypothetical protein
MRTRLFALMLSALCILLIKPASAQQESFTCQFNSGARAGSTFNFEGVPGALPGPVGTPCRDGQGSSGVLVTPQPLSTQASALPETGWSATCRFTAGARAGQIVNFGSTPGVRWGVIGRACQDDAGSTGSIVAADTPGAVWSGNAVQLSSPGLSCRFTAGPFAGQTASFAGVPGAQPAPLGATCGDSAGSTGVIAP